MVFNFFYQTDIFFLIVKILPFFQLFPEISNNKEEIKYIALSPCSIKCSLQNESLVLFELK